MENDDVADVFIDHKETQIQVPRPRQLSSSGAEITQPEDDQPSQSELATQSHVTTNTTTTTTHISAQESSRTTTTVKKHVTTIYTQRISGRSSSSSSETSLLTSEQGGGDADSDGAVFTERAERTSEEVIPKEGFVFGPSSKVFFDGERAGEIHVVRPNHESGSGDGTPAGTQETPTSPTEVCSIAVSVAAGVSSSTTTVYSKMFGKTVDTTSDTTTTTTEFSDGATKERHLSECSFSVSGASAQETSSQDVGDDNAFVSNANDQARREDSVSVGELRTEDVSQPPREETGAVSAQDNLYSQEAEDSSASSTDLPSHDSSQESRGDTIRASELNTVGFSQEANEHRVSEQGPNTYSQNQEMRGDSLLESGPNTLQFTQEADMFSGVDSSAVQSYAQEARDDGGIPASGLSTTERAQGDAAVLASGLSVHSQSRESGEIGGAEENTNQESVQGHNVTETSTASTEAEEKEVSEYSPGLAIRTLTLEDLKEKRTSPELDVSHNTENVTRSAADTLQNWSSEMGMSQLTMSETTTVMTASETSGSRTAMGQLLMQCTDDTTSRPRPPSNPVEVERKFTITNDTEKRLQELGAQLQKEKVFTDVYYDNDDYALILTDCWLRRRNDAWEVKMPVTSADGSNAVDKPSTQYRELTDEKEISAWLVDRLHLDSWLRGDPVDLLVQAVGLAEFARFTTTRRSYKLQDCTIDLDLTDHGFRVGEIEVMAASPEDVPKALKTVSDVAEQLGLCPLRLL